MTKQYLARTKFTWIGLYDAIRDPRSAIKAWVATISTALVAWLGDIGVPLPDGTPAAIEAALVGLALGFFAWLLPNYPRADRVEDRAAENRRFYGR